MKMLLRVPVRFMTNNLIVYYCNFQILSINEVSFSIISMMDILVFIKKQSESSVPNLPPMLTSNNVVSANCQVFSHINSVTLVIVLLICAHNLEIIYIPVIFAVRLLSFRFEINLLMCIRM